MKVRPVGQAGSSKDPPPSSAQSLQLAEPVQDLMSQSQSVIGTMFESAIVGKIGGSNSVPSSPPRHNHPTIYEKQVGETIISSEKIMSVSDTEMTNTGREFPNLYEVPTTEGNVFTSNHPEIHQPESVEHHFAEDSGIVESIEQAKAALDDYQTEYESSLR